MWKLYDVATSNEKKKLLENFEGSVKIVCLYSRVIFNQISCEVKKIFKVLEKTGKKLTTDLHSNFNKILKYIYNFDY